MATGSTVGGERTDVFAAAEHLQEISFGRARAVGSDEIELQCRTWGSGSGRGHWVDRVFFEVIAGMFDLRLWRNKDGRDELVVAVPMDMYDDVVSAIAHLDQDEPESWPWIQRGGSVERKIEAAARWLGCEVEFLNARPAALQALRIT